MNKKGFTLIELLGSIVILVAIALIALPAVLNLLGNSQSEIDSATKQYIENAAREYVADKLEEDANYDIPQEISVDTLLSENYISSKDEKYDKFKDKKVKIKQNTGTTEDGHSYNGYEYKFQE